MFQVALHLFSGSGLKVLGYAANISPEEVVRLINEKRAGQGLPALTLNQNLSTAAMAKAVDMLNKDYWAHVAPDGTQPWKFFLDVGYQYRFAGENLARDFSNPNSAVEAWMASPTHRENLLSSKYDETGVAVIEGDLAGVDTTIIVQLFGSVSGSSVVVPIAQANPPSISTEQEVALTEPSPLPAEEEEEIVRIADAAQGAEEPVVGSSYLASPFDSTKAVSLATVGILLTVLVVDGVVHKRRAIPRVAGRTFAHFAFFGMIFAIALILKAGQIL